MITKHYTLCPYHTYMTQMTVKTRWEFDCESSSSFLESTMRASHFLSSMSQPLLPKYNIHHEIQLTNLPSDCASSKFDSRDSEPGVMVGGSMKTSEVRRLAWFGCQCSVLGRRRLTAVPRLRGCVSCRPSLGSFTLLLVCTGCVNMPTSRFNSVSVHFSHKMTLNMRLRFTWQCHIILVFIYQYSLTLMTMKCKYTLDTTRMQLPKVVKPSRAPTVTVFSIMPAKLQHHFHERYH